ncbi:MAG: hypothetical protein ACXW18_12460, partial [Pyrinomonadaceae bacterium]
MNQVSDRLHGQMVFPNHARDLDLHDRLQTRLRFANPNRNRKSMAGISCRLIPSTTNRRMTQAQ